MWCVTVMLLMASKHSAVNHVRGKVVRIQPPMGRRRSAVKKFCAPNQERSSLRGLTRTFGVARNTVKGWLKQTAAELPPLSETLVEPDATDPEATTLE